MEKSPLNSYWACCLLLLLAVSGWRCSDKPETTSEDRPAPRISGLFSPVMLNPDSTVIYLEDYFPAGDWPDMIGGTDLGIQFLEKNKQLVLYNEGQQVAPVSSLELKFGPHRYYLPLKRSAKEIHTFSYQPAGKQPQKVQVAGSFNGWNPSGSELELKEGTWKMQQALAPGLYQYQIVVDGEWQLDPAAEVTVPNGMGGFNSQLEIGKAKESLQYAISPAADGLIIDGGLKENNVLALWENELIPIERVGKGSLKIILPDAARELDRSHLRIFLFAEGKASEDLLIPLENGAAVTQTNQLTGADQHANILYFMLVDRFHNGDPANDQPVDDPRVDPKANYHGGDLAGIRAKLESGFFDSLNINTIWISPLNQNPENAFQEYPEPHRWFSGYHGYWPVSSSRVDHRFGTNDELKDLVQIAHRKDYKVILDFVANHVHEQHPLIQAHPNWKTQLYLPDSTMNVRIWDDQRLTTWFDTFLPSLDFSRPEVVTLQSDSALFWLTEFNLDGFRHDATKHIPTDFWRQLTKKIKLSQERPVFQIGETFGNRELIGAYVGSGMMDGQFDFNMYFDLRSVLTSKTPDANQIVKSLQASLDQYGYHHLMGNVSGNHDMPRFIAYAGKGIDFSEDPKEAGWSRNVGVKDPVGYRKLEQLHAFLMLAPGVPVVYYGDEIGMSGADDPDNRRDMRFSGLSDNEQRVRNTVSMLADLRRNSMAALYGQTRVAAPDENTFVMVRRYMDEEVALLLNLGNKSRKIAWSALLEGPDWKDQTGNSVSRATDFSLQANGFAILRR